MPAKLFSIYGRVQGVGFRFFTLQQAGKLGIQGYVRNCHDGSVEVLAVADVEVLSQFEQWLHQGSPSARVERVITSDYCGAEKFTQFEIRR